MCGTRERADEGGRETPAGAVNVTEVRSADVLEVGVSRAIARERCALVRGDAWLCQAPHGRSPIACGRDGRCTAEVTFEGTSCGTSFLLRREVKTGLHLMQA